MAKSIKLKNNTYWDSSSVINDRKKLSDELNDLNKIGKSLWRGNFTSGSITINGLSKYKIIGVFTSDSVMCIGSKNYGCGGFLEYGSDKNISFNAYRFSVNGDTLTIDLNNKGVSNGTKQISAVEIFGII